MKMNMGDAKTTGILSANTEVSSMTTLNSTRYTASLLPGSLPQHQQGAVLLLGLIMLVVFSVLSVSAAQTGIMNERVAANHYRNAATFQLAESAAPYALDQGAWVNQAIGAMEAENKTVGAFAIPVEGNNNSLSVTLEASFVALPKTSLVADSGTCYIQIKTQSQATLDNGPQTRVEQGSVRVAAC